MRMYIKYDLNNIEHILLITSEKNSVIFKIFIYNDMCIIIMPSRRLVVVRGPACKQVIIYIIILSLF